MLRSGALANAEGAVMRPSASFSRCTGLRAFSERLPPRRASGRAAAAEPAPPLAAEAPAPGAAGARCSSGMDAWKKASSMRGRRYG
jgi:hypothetical protein